MIAVNSEASCVPLIVYAVYYSFRQHNEDILVARKSPDYAVGGLRCVCAELDIAEIRPTQPGSICLGERIDRVRKGCCGGKGNQGHDSFHQQVLDNVQNETVCRQVR